MTFCNPTEHNWIIEAVEGESKYMGEVVLKFRCKKCNASLKGEVKR